MSRTFALHFRQLDTGAPITVPCRSLDAALAAHIAYVWADIGWQLGARSRPDSCTLGLTHLYAVEDDEPEALTPEEAEVVQAALTRWVGDVRAWLNEWNTRPTRLGDPAEIARDYEPITTPPVFSPLEVRYLDPDTHGPVVVPCETPEALADAMTRWEEDTGDGPRIGIGATRHALTADGSERQLTDDELRRYSLCRDRLIAPGTHESAREDAPS